MTRSRIAGCLGIAIAGILLILLALVIAIGPISVLQIIQYGDSDIDDFTHNPGRILHASLSPFRFPRSDTELAVPAAALLDYGSQGELDQILASSDSIAFLVVQADRMLYERYFQGHTFMEYTA